MSGGVLKINTTGFNAALATMLSQSKREHEVVMREAAKGVIRNVVRVTPPGRSTSMGSAEAKKAGTSKTAADILKVLEGVPVKVAEVKEENAFRAIHKKARVGGQVKGTPTRVKVPKTALNAYIKKQQKKVGRLAAGWNKAAQSLGVKLPAWIATHSTSGAYSIKVTSSGIRIKATNSSPYASKVDSLSKQVQHAVNMQAKSMRLRIAKANHVAARKAGFKSGLSAGKSGLV